ncbi:FecCD family ABC transporter permease [Solirubrobacter soli]|uniref:FecCD family ABC transporter permease n=1 Tax=Solirubrobacter soli TaxID=363832 RepID=UPI000480A950|nr:iron chelate uptake ABC transporter family permease subunit [Solirubrobacter soli]
MRAAVFSARVRPRGVVATAALALAAGALAVVAIGTGDFALSPAAVVDTLLGGGPPGADFIVNELRLPRVLAALVSGAALGISGAIFQAITRNPLGSPDVVGFQAGCVTGALFVITIVGGGGLEASAGAVVGGLVTAAIVYGLAFKSRRLSSFRLVLVGIAMAALMLALTDFMLSRARIEEAQEATRWLLGSLNGRTWEEVRPLLIASVVLLPLAAPAARSLKALELGDDAAHGLGLPVERARAALVALAVGLVAATTTAIGPVAFVALAAPQIAKRVLRTAEPSLIGAAVTGALIVQASDLVAQRLVPGTPLPVGVVTGAVGGVYLVSLLAAQWRRSA